MQRRARLSAFVLSLTLAMSLAAASPSLWTVLMAGNARYVHGHLVYSHLRAHREHTREHQNPPVTVLSCSDSRVPPELIFDETIGRLFVVRVAGNVVDDFNLASVEYAVLKGYTKMIVVIGHENCGAVDAALGPDSPAWSAELLKLVTKIRENLRGQKPPIREAVILNARASTKQLLERSTIIREAVRDRRIELVTAYYSFDGKVTRLHED
jgi:carbonic anhydrase